MATVTIYTKEHCSYCDLAKTLLSERHIAFEEIRIDLDAHQREEMIRLTNRRTAPQIVIDQETIGGYEGLARLAKSGKLDTLLKS